MRIFCTTSVYLYLNDKEKGKKKYNSSLDFLKVAFNCLSIIKPLLKIF